MARVTFTVSLLFVIYVYGAIGIDPTVEATLDALNKTLNMLLNFTPDQVVPDILFGVILTLDQVRILLKNLQQNSCTVDLTYSERYRLITELTDFVMKMKKIVNDNRGNVPLLNDFRRNIMIDRMLNPSLWLIDQPLLANSLTKPTHAKNTSLSYEDWKKMLYDGLPNEVVSDYCIGEILGAYSAPCYVSYDCREIMFGPQMSTGYPLTHRLLYLQAARQAGCKSIGRPEEVKTFSHHFCSAILNEAQFLEDAGYPTVMTDLFAEQVCLCGMEGYTEFTKWKWLDTIIRWQEPEGCWKMNITREDLEEDDDENDSDHKRRKREDALMAFNCSMHFTAVASCAISTGLRSLIECSWES